MQFNSYTYVFAFLPIVVSVFLALARGGRNTRASRAWLVLVSLVFYGWWHPPYVALLLASVAANFLIGRKIATSRSGSLLALGVALNLGTLGYYKYAGFFAANLSWATGWEVSLGKIVLPLAISFFTFQQVTYLVDAWKGNAVDYDLLDYTLFVTFFPQLVAGPIVHHQEMMPQFAATEVRERNRDLAVGVTIFVIGLGKKVLLGDTAGGYADSMFRLAEQGRAISGWSAWIGALAFALQVYFDFSGYSDMAIGAARLFGIRLPVNFDSPYKATNVADFWRRWHMTLTRLIYSYLHTPIALFVTRRIAGRSMGRPTTFFLASALPLAVTFLLVGLWHGAAWTFVVFGLVHGGFLIFNAMTREVIRWRRKRRGEKGKPPPPGRARTWLYRAITFGALVSSMVLFRAESWTAVSGMYRAMLGFNGYPIPQRLRFLFGPLAPQLEAIGIGFGAAPFLPVFAVLTLPPLLAVVWFLPNTQQIMAYERPVLESADPPSDPPARWQWQPTLPWACAVAFVGVCSVLALTAVEPFIYFQF